MPSILLIDDEPQIRMLYTYILTQAGYDVVTACDGYEGVQCFQTHPVPLVITDLLMPGQNGFETIRILRTLAPTLKILLVSGWTSLTPGMGLAKLQGCGADRVLQKPVSRVDLLTAVQSLLATEATSNSGEFSGAGQRH
jgi:DNA-binding response OmpR family regulator